MAGMKPDQVAMFDDDYRLRVFDPEMFSTADELQGECDSFTDKMKSFNKMVEEFVELVDTQAQKIEKEKLKCIGLKNRIEAEQENRTRKIREMKALIAEKQGELDRLYAQHDSLLKVEATQKQQLERLAQ